MPSLRELQASFAANLQNPLSSAVTLLLADSTDADERLAVYRRAAAANYRRALAATYPIVHALVGAAFFDAAVDHYRERYPSRSGDLNTYGAEFGDFLAVYPHAAELAYLPDVARLEWALDEANRAADARHSPEALLQDLAAVPPERLPFIRLQLAASCRLVASAYPILCIWRFHQTPNCEEPVDLAAGGETVLIRREAQGVTLSRLDPGEGAWLAACADGAALGAAIDAARAAQPSFDFAVCLQKHLAAGSFDGVAAS